MTVSLSLRTVLAIVLALAAAADFAISIAVIYHLHRYTLPTWGLANILALAYLALSLALFAAALLFLLRMPPEIRIETPLLVIPPL